MSSKISFSKGIWIISILTFIGIIVCLIFLGNDAFLQKNSYDIIKMILFFLVILTFIASYSKETGVDAVCYPFFFLSKNLHNKSKYLHNIIS